MKKHCGWLDTQMVRLFMLVSVLVLGQSLVVADPITPVYTATFGDAITGDAPNPYLRSDGKRRWTIDPGADSYQNEFYERPTTQTYQVNTATPAGGVSAEEIFAATEYFENLDIVQAQAGFDETYLYILIDMFGVNHLTESGSADEGLAYEYHFLISPNPDGAAGYWLSTIETAKDIGTTYQLLQNQGQQDLKNNGVLDPNGDVGGSGLANGLSITKEDDPTAALGDGYDTDIIDDGRLISNNKPVLWSRINPSDPSIIEFALDYGLLGFTGEDIGNLGYLDFRAIKGGPKDPQNFLWNDEYTKFEAGSPYPGAGGLSEFGTQGLGNIYELDTLRGGAVPPIPEPGTLFLLGSGLVGIGLKMRRKLRG